MLFYSVAPVGIKKQIQLTTDPVRYRPVKTAGNLAQYPGAHLTSDAKWLAGPVVAHYFMSRVVNSASVVIQGGLALCRGS
jgi:hypothetical protein